MGSVPSISTSSRAGRRSTSPRRAASPSSRPDLQRGGADADHVADRAGGAALLGVAGRAVAVVAPPAGVAGGAGGDIGCVAGGVGFDGEVAELEVFARARRWGLAIGPGAAQAVDAGGGEVAIEAELPVEDCVVELPGAVGGQGVEPGHAGLGGLRAA